MSELDLAKPAEVIKKRKSYYYFGPTGTGKTTLALKHPGPRKLIIDLEERVHEMEHLTDADRAGLVVWQPLVPITDKLQMQEIDRTRRDVTMGTKILFEPKGMLRLTNLINELLAICRKDVNSFPYDVVILDGTSWINNHLSALVMFQHKVSLLNQTLYGVILNDYINIIDSFLQFPCDRIVISHSFDEIKRDKETDAILSQKTLPLIIGGFRNEVCRKFSEVYYFTGRDSSGKYHIQTVADRMVTARTGRVNLKADEIADPSRIYQ
jgi:hypothetical protein